MNCFIIIFEKFCIDFKLSLTLSLTVRLKLFVRCNCFLEHLSLIVFVYYISSQNMNFTASFVKFKKLIGFGNNFIRPYLCLDVLSISVISNARLKYIAYFTIFLLTVPVVSSGKTRACLKILYSKNLCLIEPGQLVFNCAKTK